MAQRRMFTLQIVDSDAFLDMPASSQLLYFHLSMRADDDGFIGNPKKIIRATGASDDDFKILIAKRFILVFESGVIVIKHWKMHNYIQKDRYNETQYLEEKSKISVKENGSYTECIQDGYKLDTQVRLELGKVRLGKDTYTSLSYLQNIPEEDLQEFYDRFDCSKGKIKDKAESLYLYCTSKGRVYKNYKSFLLNALKKDFQPRVNNTVDFTKKTEEFGDRSELLKKHKPDFIR